MTSNPIAYVVDDEIDVRESLRMLLKSVAIDVETYASATDFLSGFSGCNGRAAVLLLDVRMSDMSGMALLEQLRREHPWLPIIMITGHGHIEMAVKAMKLGARDFFTKPFKGQDMLDRVQDVLRECPDEGTKTDPDKPEPSVKLQTLTAREREIYDLLVTGRANKAIAADLGISVRTVESHRANIMEKLGAKTLVDLVLMTLDRESPL